MSVVDESNVNLKRGISLPLLTLYGLGTILGAGVYVLIGKVAAVAGFHAPLAFLLAALLAGLSGCSYAALSSRYPRSAGESAYVQAAFSWPLLSQLIGWMVVATGLVSAATIARGFVGYFNVFFSLSSFWTISLLVVVLATLACWGVMQSVWAAAVITLLELAGLILVVVVASDSLMQLPENWGKLLPAAGAESGVYLAILSGAFLAFYAFIGFEDMVNMAEEVRQPQRTLPRAIIAALLISSVLYILIAIVAVLALPLAQLQQSDAPMTEILANYSKRAAVVISVISLVAVVNGALVQMIMGARVLYGMARQNLAPAILGRVHARWQTPVIATLLISACIWGFAIALPLLTLAKATSFIIIAVFMTVNLALIKVLLSEQMAPPDVMTVPVAVPVLASLMSAVFLWAQISQW